MKILFIILSLSILLNCASRTTADKVGSNTPHPKPTIDDANNVNVNNRKPIQYEADKIDENKQKELDAQNEKFRQVPDEFKIIDFENFKYPLTRLKNGENDERGIKYASGQSFSLSGVYYVDLTGDDKKEAIVFLYTLRCGGSCDGGSETIYFYNSSKGKANLLDEIATGSKSGSCSLKSFKVQDKKIILEQFGKCETNTSYEENTLYFCKFCVKDMTRSVYSFKNSELVKESSEVFETPEINVMSYSFEVSIND